MAKRGRKAADKVIDIAVDQIDRPEISARRSILEEGLHELEESIQRLGLIQPIVVKKKVDNRYEIIAGDRRYLAHVRLSKATIKAIVVNPDKGTSEAMKIDENNVRQDLNIMDEAVYYASLMSKLQYSQKDIAVKTGKSEGYIAQRLKMLKAPAIITEALEDGVLTFSVARELMRIKDTRELKRLVMFAVQNGVTPSVARRWVNDVVSNDYQEEHKDDEAVDDHPVLSNVPYDYFECQICGNKAPMNTLRIIKSCSGCQTTILSAGRAVDQHYDKP